MFLGSTVRDKITGFAGVVTGFVEYISGCNQVLVVPRIKPDGSVADPAWFDVQRIEVDPTVPRIVLNNEGTPGFDMAPPKR